MTSRTLSLFFFATVLATAEAAPTVQRGLTVTVLQGDGVVHALPNPGSSHISIRVADADGKPIQGAVAVFELPELGPSATLADGSQVKVVLTDGSGSAGIEMQSNGVPGHFEPKITVNYLGQTAVVTLKQENGFNPEARPEVYGRTTLPRNTSDHAARSHWLSKKAVWGIVGAAAVACVVAIFRHHRPAGGSTGGGLTITPGSGTVGGQ